MRFFASLLLWLIGCNHALCLQTASPVITDIVMVPKLTIRADQGGMYQIQYSSNLLDWTASTNLVIDGESVFVDTEAFAPRFYRVVQLEPQEPVSSDTISVDLFTGFEDGQDGELLTVDIAANAASVLELPNQWAMDGHGGFKDARIILTNLPTLGRWRVGDTTNDGSGTRSLQFYLTNYTDVPIWEALSFEIDNVYERRIADFVMSGTILPQVLHDCSLDVFYGRDLDGWGAICQVKRESGVTYFRAHGGILGGGSRFGNAVRFDTNGIYQITLARIGNQVEVIVQDVQTGELIGTSSCATSTNYIRALRVQNYLQFTPADNSRVVFDNVAAAWNTKVQMPLLPINLTTVSNVHAVQTAVNRIEVSWQHRATDYDIQRWDHLSQTWNSLATNYSFDLVNRNTAGGITNGTVVYVDTQVTDLVQYLYRVSPRIGFQRAEYSESNPVVLDNSISEPALPSGLILYEDFEHGGFQEYGWLKIGPTAEVFNEDYTDNVLAGGQSFFAHRNSFGSSIAYKFIQNSGHFGRTNILADEIWGTFKFKYLTNAADSVAFFKVSNSKSETLLQLSEVKGKLRVTSNGTAGTDSIDDFQNNVTYYIKFHVKKGTGNDGIAEACFAEAYDDLVFSGNQYTATVESAQTTPVQHLRIGMESFAVSGETTALYDNLIVTTNAF